MFIYSIGQDKKSQEECKMEWERVDLRVPTPELKETWEETKRSEQLCFKINTTMPYTEEYNQLVQELPFFRA